MPGEDRIDPASLEAAIIRYYQSQQFKALREITKKTYRTNIEWLRARFGPLPIAEMRPKHVKKIMSERADTPTQANKTLKMMKLIVSTAIDDEMITHDPTAGVKPFKIAGDGYHSWTEQEILQFETRFKTGTKERLAMALLLFTAQRRSDVVRMGWQHISLDGIRVTQQKTGAELILPIHPALAEILAQTSKTNLTILITEYGRPYTSNGFGNWFAKACKRAGIPQCSSHGLRKAAARRLAEAGATAHEIMAVTGHQSVAEVTRYTKAAEQAAMARRAMTLVSDQKSNGKMANPVKKVRQKNAQDIEN
ncbi:MAG: site-specific integrase [Pseudomonadota bacterium]